MSDDVETIARPHATLLFHGSRCIHSRNCVLNRPDVFVPNVEGEWIHPEAATYAELLALAEACPSGAIQVRRPDGGNEEHRPPVNYLKVLQNGPLAIRADLRVGEHETFRATLCRCGASKHKPFCDGSHHEVDFEATGEPATGEVATLESRGGPLEVRPQANGPLVILGNLEICAGTGRPIWRGQKVALCRCGGSGNKPFCDGTHAKNGFTADGV